MTLQLAVTVDAFAVAGDAARCSWPHARRVAFQAWLQMTERSFETVNRRFGGRGHLEGNPLGRAPADRGWCGARARRTESGGAGVVIPGDASSGRWLMQAHIPKQAQEATNVDAEWLAVHLGLNALLWRWEPWPPRYPTEYGGGSASASSGVFSLETLVETCITR